MKYIKQLDGLRALAVIAVIIHHWAPHKVIGEDIYRLGAYGVDLFFVLSGFLITTILIKQKENDQSFKASYRTFLIRRSLRIFPIYFIFIAIFFQIFPDENVLAKLSAFFYQFNWYLWLSDVNAIVYIRHIWSLSAEEQFYIFWPAIILLLKKENGLKITSLIFFGCMILNAGAYLLFNKLNIELGEMKFFPFNSFMALSLGGILAFLKIQKIDFVYRRGLFFGLALIFLFLHPNNYIFPDFYGKSLLRTAIPIVPLMCMLIIDKTLIGFQGPIKSLLENKTMIFIGKISYGLYLFHMLIPYFLLKLNIQNAILEVMIGIILLFFITTVSYTLVEKPFNKLKRRFSY